MGEERLEDRIGDGVFGQHRIDLFDSDVDLVQTLSERFRARRCSSARSTMSFKPPSWLGLKKPPSLLDEGFAEGEKRRRAILYEGFFVR